jgi:hypothetical protein
MSNFIVRIDHLSEDQLCFFGWVRIDSGEEFSLYWNPRYNETQPVANTPPRYLIIDDLNDATFMSRGKPIIQGPIRRH